MKDIRTQAVSQDPLYEALLEVAKIYRPDPKTFFAPSPSLVEQMLTEHEQAGAFYGMEEEGEIYLSRFDEARQMKASMEQAVFADLDRRTTPKPQVRSICPECNSEDCSFWDPINHCPLPGF